MFDISITILHHYSLDTTVRAKEIEISFCLSHSRFDARLRAHMGLLPCSNLANCAHGKRAYFRVYSSNFRKLSAWRHCRERATCRVRFPCKFRKNLYTCSASSLLFRAPRLLSLLLAVEIRKRQNHEWTGI